MGQPARLETTCEYLQERGFASLRSGKEISNGESGERVERGAWRVGSRRGRKGTYAGRTHDHADLTCRELCADGFKNRFLRQFSASEEVALAHDELQVVNNHIDTPPLLRRRNELRRFFRCNASLLLVDLSRR
jgi:hypothetical protein